MTVSTKASARAYNNSKDLYEDLEELFMSLENSSGAEKQSIIKDIKYSIKALRNEYKKVKVEILSKEYGIKLVADIDHNLTIFRESTDSMIKKIWAIDYYDKILPNINKYIMGVMPTLDKNDIAKFGDNPKQLKQKFLSKILAPNKIGTFKLKLNQLAQSTMSQNMFNSIFKGLLYNHAISTGERKVTQAGHRDAQERAKKELSGGFQSLKSFKKNPEIDTPQPLTNQMRSDLITLGYEKKIIDQLDAGDAVRLMSDKQQELIDNKKHAIERAANVKFRKKE